MGSLLSSESAYKRAREYIESSVRANKVMLFTKSNCGYCELVIHILNNMEVPFGEAQIDQMKDGSYVHDKLIGMTGMRSVPNVWVNGKFVGGYEEVKGEIQSGKFYNRLDEAHVKFKKYTEKFYL